MADIDEDELLADLGLEITPLKAASRTPREERIIAGFEDILRFHESWVFRSIMTGRSGLS